MWPLHILVVSARAPFTVFPCQQGGVPTPSGCSLYLVNRDALFSYHPASEEFLQRLQSLFVSSHYKNSPNDLQLLADAPAHLVFALIPTLGDDASCVPDIYCAIQVKFICHTMRVGYRASHGSVSCTPNVVSPLFFQVAIEGFLSRASVRDALGRGQLPSGDLLPWTLSQAFVDEDVGMLSGVSRRSSD